MDLEKYFVCFREIKSTQGTMLQMSLLGPYKQSQCARAIQIVRSRADVPDGLWIFNLKPDMNALKKHVQKGNPIGNFKGAETLVVIHKSKPN